MGNITERVSYAYLHNYYPGWYTTKLPSWTNKEGILPQFKRDREDKYIMNLTIPRPEIKTVEVIYSLKEINLNPDFDW